MNLTFRDLRADEIECRVSTVSEKGVSLLLYKDARCDMNILDETVGATNWMRSHCRDNANCIVSIWDEDKKQWVSKEDTGTESNTEAAKGLASDSFKRSCFNWGIGRCLYTAPFVWIKAADCKIVEDKRAKSGFTCKDRFTVTDVEIKDKKIVKLIIHNDSNGKRVFAWGNDDATVPTLAPVTSSIPADRLTLEQREKILELCGLTGTDLKKIKDRYKVATIDELTQAHATKAIEILTNMLDCGNAG